MTFRTRFNKKNKRICVPCVPSCVPLKTKGTHAQTKPCKHFTTFVYHVYHCARARIRESYFLKYIFNYFLNNFHCSKKSPRVRDIVLMVHMVHISLKSLPVKVLACVPFFEKVHKKPLMVHKQHLNVFKHLFFNNKKCVPLFLHEGR